MNLPGVYPIFLNNWQDLQTCWIISDTHFGDEDLCQGISNRPSDEDIVKSINSKVGRKDLLLLLGDVGNVEFVKKIRAQRKILIMGNHDAGRTNYERVVGDYCCDKDKWLTKEKVLANAKIAHPGCEIRISETENSWVVFYDNRLFDEVYEGPLMIAEKLILSHEPVNVPWAFNIHGHIHDTRHKNNSNHFCVTADIINYTPVNMNQWMKSGAMAKVETIHRETIDKATERKKKRGGKKIGGK